MTRKRTLLLIGLVLLLGLACQVPEQIASTATTVAQQTLPSGSPAGATVTPTPFLPVDATAVSITPTMGATPSWGSYPGPIAPPGAPIPPPVAPFKQPAGQVNILLMGSDQRPGEGGFRTDTILLLTLNPGQGIVNITSFPRDLYVYIPGWTMQRINTAPQHGGFELMAATFGYNLGVHPDYYVMINFWGFVEVIDSLGGIDVNAAKSFTDDVLYIPAGPVHMNGEIALWYVRSRYTTNDFDRARRQQEVLLATFKKFISLDAITRAPELYELYRDNITTNMEFDDVAPLLGLATQLGNDPSQIQTYLIGPQQVKSYIVPYSGAQVLLPKHEAVLEVMRQALNAP